MAASTNIGGGLAASYVMIPGKSRFQVRAEAAGLLAAFGHNPTIAIRNFTGEASYRPQAPEQSSLRVEVDPASLTVTGKVTDKDRREIERTMHDEVLETARYPEIRLESSGIEAVGIGGEMYRLEISGKLLLHGVTRDLRFPATVTIAEDSLRGYGEFTIRQTDYGIRLVSVAGGTLKLKDELKFTFDVVARGGRKDRGLDMCLAIPGRILSLADDPAHTALVEVVGVRRRVDVSLVEPDGIAPGDWVLIHVGFAMSKINAADAAGQLRMLMAMGETEAAVEEVRGYHDEPEGHTSP